MVPCHQVLLLNRIFINLRLVMSRYLINMKEEEIHNGFDRFVSTVIKLKQSAKLKENFIAGMIHDIRNPLSSMICSLDYMKENEKIQDDDDISNMLEIASHCAEFIISHVGNFLDISKLENSKIELCPSPTEIIELIRKIVCMHRFKAENKQLYLKLNATDNVPEMALMDNARFTQVLVNLVSNAIKFTQEGGVTVNIYFRENNANTLTAAANQGQQKLLNQRKIGSQSIGIGSARQDSNLELKKTINNHFMSNHMRNGSVVKIALSKDGTSDRLEEENEEEDHQDSPPPPLKKAPSHKLSQIQIFDRVSSFMSNLSHVNGMSDDSPAKRGHRLGDSPEPTSNSPSPKVKPMLESNQELTSTSVNAKNQVIQVQKTLLASILEESKENFEVQKNNSNSLKTSTQKGAPGQYLCEGAGLMSFAKMTNDVINQRITPPNTEEAPILTKDSQTRNLQDQKSSQRLFPPRNGTDNNMSTSFNEDMDCDMSERILPVIGKTPQPFFNMLVSCASKNRAISGKQQMANPFEFCSNEFSAGGNSSDKDNGYLNPFQQQQNMIDQVIDSIKAKRNNSGGNADSVNNINSFSTGLEGIGSKQLTSNAKQTNYFKNLETIEEEIIFAQSFENKLGSPPTPCQFLQFNVDGSRKRTSISKYERGMSNNQNNNNSLINDRQAAADQTDVRSNYSRNANNNNNTAASGMGGRANSYMNQMPSPSMVNSQIDLIMKDPLKGTLIIEVQDTGIGIDQDNIEKLFKPFSSASDDHHKQFGGTGLGLWISKVIVELMGGKVQVRSELGQGSCFSFQLPIQYYKNVETNSPVLNNNGGVNSNLKSLENAGGSASNLLPPRSRKLTDAATIFTGQEVMIVSKNSEDVLLLKERLKIIKDCRPNQAQSIDQLNLEQMFRIKKNHVIFFIDDLKQTQNATLQKYRNLERLTIVYVNDTYAAQQQGSISGGNFMLRPPGVGGIEKSVFDSNTFSDSKQNFVASDHGSTSFLPNMSQSYDYMLKKPYRSSDMLNLFTWIRPRIMGGKNKKTIQLMPVFEISQKLSPMNSPAPGGAASALSGKQQLMSMQKGSKSQRNVFAQKSNLLPKIVQPILENLEEENSYDNNKKRKSFQNKRLSTGMTQEPRSPMIGGAQKPAGVEYLDPQSFNTQAPSQKPSLAGFSNQGTLKPSTNGMMSQGHLMLQNQSSFHQDFNYMAMASKNSITTAPYFGKQTYKILLVDDDGMIQHVMPEVMKLALQSAFNPSDFEVIVAGNGAAGLDMFEKNMGLIKLIFTDFEMPQLTGPQMVEEIRKLERQNQSGVLPNLPVGEEPGQAVTIIGLTGHDSPQIQQTGIDSGMNLVIKKPPQLKDVKELFRQYLFKGHSSSQVVNGVFSQIKEE